jgi:hypothetical protein
MYKIEKDIPIRTYFKYPFHKMDVGDSFFLAIKDKKERVRKQQNIISYAYMYSLRNKIEFKVKTETDYKGIRVWRIV